MKLLFQSFFFFLIGVFLITPGKGFSQDINWDKSQVEILLSEARQDRRFAEDRLDFAKSYDARAEDARKNAAESRMESDRKSWIEIAEESEAKAQQFRDEANALLKSAAKKEAEAAEIQKRIDQALANAPPEPEPVSPAQPPPSISPSAAPNGETTRSQKMPLDQIFGVWYKDLDKQSEPFVIVPPGSGGSSKSLEAHTDNRVWKGSYDEAENPKKGRVNFTYRPTYAEMNPDIPEWARKILEGTLEWRIELNEPCGCGGAGLDGKFFPGEVAWAEGGEEDPSSVKVIGDGEPREFKLAKSTGFQFETDGFARIAVNIKSDKDPFLEPIDGLTKLQRFTVLVDMPVEMAKEKGEAIEITITDLRSGDSTNITLQKASVIGGHTARYFHYNEATFADQSHVTESDFHPSFMSLSYILDNQGARLDLEVENGDQVEFRFEDATQVVPVYNSWVQRNIARYDDAAKFFRFLCGSVIQSDAPRAQKERATQCLNLVRNYENIMASDTIHDYIRYRVGLLYFDPATGLIGQDLSVRGDGIDAIPPDIRDEDRVSQKFANVIWVSNIERQKVMTRVNAAREDYRDIARNEISKSITYALYDYVMGQTGVGDAYTLFTGKDIFNKPVPGWQRITSAIGLTSSTTLSLTMPRVLPRIATLPSLERSLLTRGQAGGVTTLGKATKLTEETVSNGPAPSPEGLPATLNEGQVQAVGPRALPIAETFVENSITCGVEPKVTSSAPLPSNLTPPPPAPGPLPQIDPDLAGIQTRYGVETEVIAGSENPSFPRQEFGTCNWGSVAPNVAKETHLVLDESRSFVWLLRNKFIEAGRAVLTDGYLTKTVNKFLKFLGAETVPIERGNRLTLEELSIALENGWYVRDVVKTLDGNELHAIDIREIIRDAAGNITEVVWFDSAYGKTLKTSACNYEDNLASDLDYQLLYRWR